MPSPSSFPITARGRPNRKPFRTLAWINKVNTKIKIKSAFSQSSVLLEEVIQLNDSRGEVHQVHEVRGDDVDTRGPGLLSFHPVQDGRKIPTWETEQESRVERTPPEMETMHFHSCNKSMSIKAQAQFIH